jgi:pimeloyl-ACP methyl ester carboxylesterase
MLRVAFLRLKSGLGDVLEKTNRVGKRFMQFKGTSCSLTECFFSAVMTFVLINAHSASGQNWTAQNRTENNSWYYHNKSETVFVFVHGIFSNSTSCWTAENKVFWPELVRKDTRFKDPSIFLGGFSTSFTSLSYGLSNAADELFSALRTTDNEGRPPAISKRNVVFVAHSTGGVVVREMLDRKREQFRDKNVGLVLIASPSRGSAWSNRLAWLRRFFGNKMAGELGTDNAALIDLDRRFEELVTQKKIPRLVGIDMFESKFIVPNWLLPVFKNTYVVSAVDTGTYFGPSRTIPDADHFETVKPMSITSASHRFFAEFLENVYGPLVTGSAATDLVWIDTTRGKMPVTPVCIDVTKQMERLRQKMDLNPQPLRLCAIYEVNPHPIPKNEIDRCRGYKESLQKQGPHAFQEYHNLVDNMRSFGDLQKQVEIHERETKTACGALYKFVIDSVLSR